MNEKFIEDVLKEYLRYMTPEIEEILENAKKKYGIETFKKLKEFNDIRKKYIETLNELSSDELLLYSELSYYSSDINDISKILELV